MQKNRNLRLGLVRCDTHAFHFMSMVQKCDPALLKKHDRITWYYFSDIWTDELVKMPHIPGFELVKVWDEDPDKAKIFAETFLNKPKICHSMDDMTEGVDAVFVSDCMGDGKDHLKLSTPFVKAGIPTFIDKYLAFSLEDAVQLMRIADENETPIFSASSLSYVPTAEHFRSRFREIDQVGFGIVKNCGCAVSQENLGGRDCVFASEEETWPYAIHGIALALHIFGGGVEWVRCMGGLPWEYLLLHLKSDRDVIILNPGVDVFPERCSFYVEAYSKMGAIHSGPIGDPEFLRGAARIVAKLRDMALTGKPPVDYADILEHIAAVEAGQIAQKTGNRVCIKDVLEQA